MKAVSLVAAFALAAGLMGFSAITGQPPAAGKKADPDLAALQGEWTITKLELPPGKEAPPAELLKGFVITVRGDIATGLLTLPDGAKEQPDRGLLFLDSGKTLRQIDVTPADEKGQPKRNITLSTAKGGGVVSDVPMKAMRGIYKLEGESLVVCASVGGGDVRPTTFQALPPRNSKSYRPDDQGYVVITLAKKK